MLEKIRLYHYLKIIAKHNHKTSRSIDKAVRNPKFIKDMGEDMRQREAIIKLGKKHPTSNLFREVGAYVASNTASLARQEKYVVVTKPLSQNDFSYVNVTGKGFAFISGGPFRLGLISDIYESWKGAGKLLALIMAGLFGQGIIHAIRVVIHHIDIFLQHLN